MKPRKFVTIALIVLSTQLFAKCVDAWPKVVRADSSATITMQFEEEDLKQPDKLKLLYYNDDGIRADGKPFQYATPEIIPFEIKGNTIVATTKFPSETRHTLKLVNNENNTVADVKLYSLKPDYFALRPFKGNMHMHSKYSDGVDKTGSIMVATCRKVGQDFAIETDHNNYAGSQEAVSTFATFPTDMVTYHGEEVHGPGNGTHILSLGATEGMGEWFKQHRAEYDATVKEALAKLPPDILPKGMNAWFVASSHVIWDRIRAKGGLAVYAHPYWRPNYRQYIPKPISDYFLSELYCDAIEVVNGGSSENTILHYQGLRAQGKKIPLIGTTDAHNSRHLAGAFTLILSESVKFEDLAANIKKLNSVAVEYVARTKKHYVHGPKRVSQFALFLLEHYYDLKHDPFCQEEGEWLLTLAKAKAGELNDQDAVDKATKALQEAKGRVPALFDKYWQK